MTSRSSPRNLFLIFSGIAALLIAAHATVLRLPYFWDEAGYYIPAARDLLLTGSLVPHSTLSNAHPPLVLAYLALAWKLFAFSPVVTRIAMLLVAAFGLAGIYRLAQEISSQGVAIASTLLVAVYPVWFAQSSLAHLDIAAAALSFWALLYIVRRRFFTAALWFSLAALAKETAIIAPLAIFVWLLITQSSCGRIGLPRDNRSSCRFAAPQSHLWLLLHVVPLAVWFAYHYARTGYVFGNPEFFRYNIAATLTPARFIFAALRRLWQLAGHMNLFALTLASAVAMFMPPLREHGEESRRIALSTQLLFAVVIAAYWLALSLIGGAPLARYMLPVIPLVVIICVSTIRRRIAGWPLVIALVAAAFVAGIFINPPYVFAPEDNLAYADFIRLHQSAAEYLETHAQEARVLTAWPASDELTKPYLGYVAAPMKVVRIENFTREDVEAAAQNQDLDHALIFSTKYEPPRQLPIPAFWRRAQERYFGYHKDVTPEEAAHILGGEIKFLGARGGQWAAVIAMPEVREATTRHQRAPSANSL